ncbi:MAG: AvaI/BsoBI family type II restriction endonuclease [bacterium]
MKEEKPYLRHLSSSGDLVTTYEETRAGFVALALEKNRRATPAIEQARALKSVASHAKTPTMLTRISGIEAALLTAAGISDKAVKHLQHKDKQDAIKGLIENFLEPAGSAFVEELVFRFLITRGDTLGGSMRNIGGVLAQQKLTRTLIATLSVAGLSYEWRRSRSKTWHKKSGKDEDFEPCLRELSWSVNGKDRTLIYNLTVPIVKNNIDLCLLDCSPKNLEESYKKPECYIALGELKGGIDPAGADEHWKTARTSLSRIMEVFTSKNLSPSLFFIGAAIAKKMALEIWDQLESNSLSNAANLTNSNQVSSLCYWLCNE